VSVHDCREDRKRGKGMKYVCAAHLNAVLVVTVYARPIDVPKGKK